MLNCLEMEIVGIWSKSVLLFVESKGCFSVLLKSVVVFFGYLSCNTMLYSG